MGEQPEKTQPEPPLMVQGLLRELPPRGKCLFPKVARERWLEAARVTLDLIYGDEDEEAGDG